jgi:hypothetical protein
MARLVPATPRQDSAAEEAAVLALESGLDDSHVVFQKRPCGGGFLVLHPDRGACIVAVLEGGRRYDPDGESWEGVDPPRIARAAQQALAGAGWQGAPLPGVAVFLPDTPAGGAAPHPGMVFAGGLPALAAVAAGMLRCAGGPPGDAQVDAIIQVCSPMASPFARGAITGTQAGWRRERSEGASPPGEPARNHADAPLADAASGFVSGGGFIGEGAANGGDPPAAAIPQAMPEGLKPGSGSEGPSGPAPGLAGTFVEVEAGPPAVARPPDILKTDPLMLLIRQTVETVAAGRPLFAAGINITVADVVGLDFLLPAVLVAAGLAWAPVVSSRDGKGGFHIRLRTDQQALLGYRVVGLNPATPLLLMVPVVDQIRRMLRNGEFFLDGMVLQFHRWLAENRFNTDALSDLDVRLTLDMAMGDGKGGDGQ